MGFFSELKSDLSQAVNTLMPDDKLEGAEGLDKDKTAEEPVKATEVDIDSMLSRLDDIKLDDVTADAAESEAEDTVSEESTEEAAVSETVSEVESSFEQVETETAEVETENKVEDNSGIEELTEDLEEKIEEETLEEVKSFEPKSALEAINNSNIDTLDLIIDEIMKVAVARY